MSRYRPHLIILFFAVFLMSTACSRDPKVRSRHFLESGQAYEKTGKYDAARIEYRRAVQADPQFAEGYYRLGSLSLRLQRLQEAYRSLTRAVALDPNHVQARLELATINAAANQFDEARKLVQAALSVDSKNVEAHLILGGISLKQQQYPEALEEFQESELLAPDDPRPFTEMGIAYAASKQFPQAVESFKRAITTNKKYVLAYLNLAQVYRAQSDATSELNTLLDAIHENPQAIAAYTLAAGAYVRQGSQEKLEPLFSQLRSATGDSSSSLLAIGEFYSRLGDTQRSKDALETALEKDPRNGPVRRRLIEVELARQEWDEAEKLNGELLKLDSRDPEARLAQARLQFIRGAKSKSISILEHLVHDVPEMELAHYYLGLAYSDQGQATRAISTLNDSLKRNPDFLPAYVKLGELYEGHADAKLGLAFAQKALDRNPNYLPAQLLRVNALLQLGEYAAAGSQLTALSRSMPGNATVLERKGTLEIREQHYAKAQENFEESLQVQPDYVPALIGLIEVANLQHRPDQASARIRQQIDRAPMQTNFYELLGESYMQQGDMDHAERAFEDALRHKPDAQVAHMQLARIYWSEHRVRDAVLNAENGLKDRPEYLPAYLLLGSIYEQSGDTKNAQKTYEAALQRSSDYAPVLNNLAWLYCQNGGNLNLALSLAQRAKEKLPDDPSISDTLAWVQYRSGLYQLAAASLEDLVKKSPRIGLYQFHLGMTLLASGNTSDGRSALQRALELNLPDAEIKQAKNALVSNTAKVM